MKNNWIYDSINKCWVFKEGGEIPKFQKAGILKQLYYWRSPEYQGSFNQAYAEARKNNDEDFWWNGNIYNTDFKLVTPSTTNNKKNSYNHRFTKFNPREFIEVLYPIYKEVLEENNLPISQIQNLIRQSAFESGYGIHPRGSKGFNLGGIKWVNNPSSNTYKYNHTKGPDGEEYVDFDNLRDFVEYKVKLLNGTYNALTAKDTNEFVRRIHGDNEYEKSYSINPEGYMETLNSMKTLDTHYKEYIDSISKNE